MAVEIEGLSISFPTNADLSSNQFYFVKLSSANAVLPTAATDLPIGILQNKPKSGQNAEVMVYGVSKVVANGALSSGNTVGTDSSGKAASYANGTDTTKYIVGIVLPWGVTSANNGVATIAFNCLTPNRGA